VAFLGKILNLKHKIAGNTRAPNTAVQDARTFEFWHSSSFRAWVSGPGIQAMELPLFLRTAT
jgi:hypothetical protein